MKSRVDGKRVQKGVKNGVKMPIFYNVYKQLITVQNLVLSEIYRSKRQIRKYIFPFCMDLGYYWSKKVFRVLKGVKMPIFYNNVYKTPYNGTKPGLMGNISFQARKSKICLTILCNRYGSTGTKRSFWVLKGVKMPIFYNNVYKTPYMAFTGVPIDNCTFREIIDIALILFLNLYDI